MTFSMRSLKDKYILASVTMIIIIAAVYILADDQDDDVNIVGVVSDVKKTENGNTFILTDTNGSSIRCFSRTAVDDGAVCSITGSYSDDRTMFFVSGLTIR